MSQSEFLNVSPKQGFPSRTDFHNIGSCPTFYTMNPTQLSHELRQETSSDLTDRRWIIGLSLFGAFMGGIVSLYQTGIIPGLPDPPIPLFDSDRVDASDYAYKRLDTPDGFIMVTNYAITAWLAAAGGKDRAKTNPLLPLSMAVKTGIDSLVALGTRSGRMERKQSLLFLLSNGDALFTSLSSTFPTRSFDCPSNPDPSI
jgi:hypothetical protein